MVESVRLSGGRAAQLGLSRPSEERATRRRRSSRSSPPPSPRELIALEFFARSALSLFLSSRISGAAAAAGQVLVPPEKRERTKRMEGMERSGFALQAEAALPRLRNSHDKDVEKSTVLQSSGCGLSVYDAATNQSTVSKAAEPHGWEKEARMTGN